MRFQEKRPQTLPQTPLLWQKFSLILIFVGQSINRFFQILHVSQIGIPDLMLIWVSCCVLQSSSGFCNSFKELKYFNCSRTAMIHVLLPKHHNTGLFPHTDCKECCLTIPVKTISHLFESNVLLLKSTVWLLCCHSSLCITVCVDILCCGSLRLCMTYGPVGLQLMLLHATVAAATA